MLFCRATFFIGGCCICVVTRCRLYLGFTFYENSSPKVGLTALVKTDSNRPPLPPPQTPTPARFQPAVFPLSWGRATACPDTAGQPEVINANSPLPFAHKHTTISPPPSRQQHGSGKYGAVFGLVAAVVLVALKLFFFSQIFSGNRTENLEQEVRNSIESKFASDPDKRGETVRSFNLTKDSGNKYNGVLVMDKGGREADVTVNVTYDRRTFLWETEPYSYPESPQPPADSTPAESQPAAQYTQQQAPSYVWNTSENDAMQNGNLAVAYNYITRSPNLRSQAADYSPASVAKTPYLYYGHVVTFSGVVEVVQDYPPSSTFGQAFGGRNASDIVMMCADGTIAEMFCMKASGNITAGHGVTFYGYPIGVTEVPNRVGGTFTHLILVGNDYDDVGLLQQ